MYRLRLHLSMKPIFSSIDSKVERVLMQTSRIFLCLASKRTLLSIEVKAGRSKAAGWRINGTKVILHPFRAMDEIEEFASQYVAEEIIILPDLRQSLPSAVDTLLSWLESFTSDDAVRELNSYDLRVHGFGNLFEGLENFGMTTKMLREWDVSIRLMVMTAVGRCQTSDVIRLYDLNLTIQELKALLQPLHTSSFLRELDLHGSDIVHTKHGCKVVADFLNINNSVRIMDLGEACYKPYIHHYLAIQGHPALEVLGLHGLDIEERSSIIRTCPKLQQMERWVWEVEDKQSATMYAHFLIQHESLRHVEVKRPAEPVSSVLSSSCIGARSSTSLTGLEVDLRGTDQFLKNVFECVVLANRYLERISFWSVKIFSEEWQRLFCSFQETDVLKRLYLWNPIFEEDEGCKGRAWHELVALVKESSNLECLEIYNANHLQYDLLELFETFTSNKSGIQELYLERFQLTLDESRAFVSCVEMNDRLRTSFLDNLDLPRWEEFLNSFRHIRALKVLSVYGLTCDDRALEAFLATLQVNRNFKVLLSNHWGREVKHDLVKYGLQEEERHGVVTYAFVSTSTEDKPGVFQSLQHNAVLQCLHLSLEGIEEFDQRIWDQLEALFRKRGILESLTLFGSPKRFKHDLRTLFKLLTCTKNLRFLDLIHLEVNEEESEIFAKFIRDNTSLEQLTLHRLNGAHWKNIFRSLCYHNALQALKLSLIDSLDGGAFKELLTTLEVYSSLENIDLEDTNWQQEGKDAILREALEQKGCRQTYMAGMRAALGQEEFRVPSKGHLFLCGSPCAGKTQVRMALIEDAKQRTDKGGLSRGCVLRNIDLRRTEGIEIQLLKMNSLEISIWDRVGQSIFRTLQDVLFPKLNLACIIFFVLSPFIPDANCLKPELSDELHRDFLPWLRFISSNSQIGFNIPRVKIVRSHKDKLDNHLCKLVWAHNVLNNFRLQFAEILDIDEGIFCTNSMTLGEDVDDVLFHMVSSFENLLKNKVFDVPSTCLRTLGSVLAKPGMYSPAPPNNHLYKKRFTFLSSCHSLGNGLASRTTSKTRATIQPILPTAKFFELCQEEVQSLQSFNYSDEEGRPVLTAVAQYLHDAGNIIQLLKSDLVVLDPNWFTFSFLGRLIGAGHDFERPEQVYRYKHQTDGHVSTEAFDKLLHKFSDALRGEGYSGMDEKLSKQLIEEIDLCFYIPHAGGYFAPAIFAEEKHKRPSEGLRELAAWQCVAARPTSEQDIIFAGMRLQCRDRLRTSLTTSFFSRFQVNFRNRLISDRGLRRDNVDCDYNMIYFFMVEYEVYVESDGHPRDRIDILVRSPSSRTKTVKFIQANIVRQIQDFCASYCSGVALVVGVLRTECVEKLTLSAHRAILIRTSKENERSTS